MPPSASSCPLPARQRGLSVVESLIGAAIAATVVASAAGGLVSWRAQLGVQQAAAEFETDVHFARSLALARNETVRLSLAPAGDGACWIVHTGPRDACRCADGGRSACGAVGEVLRTAHWPSAQPVHVDANARSVAFDPLHGTASPALTVRFGAAGARSVHQVVSILGRVRSCVPGGGLSGYRPC